MIELFTANTPNGKKISIMLEEIDFKYKVTKVNINKGEQFNSKFRSKSPFSKIPVIIEPGAVSAILSGTGDNKLGKIEYLPENNNIKDGNVVYTSGADGIISSGIPVGKIVIDNDHAKVKYFSDFTQIEFVKVYYKK